MFGGERNPMTMSYSAFFFSFFFQGDPKKGLVKEKNDGGSRDSLSFYFYFYFYFVCDYSFCK